MRRAKLTIIVESPVSGEPDRFIEKLEYAVEKVVNAVSNQLDFFPEDGEGGIYIVPSFEFESSDGDLDEG